MNPFHVERKIALEGDKQRTGKGDMTNSTLSHKGLLHHSLRTCNVLEWSTN